MESINRTGCPSQASWNRQLIADRPMTTDCHAMHARSLKVEAIWSSKRQPRFDFTVVTQLSFDRMPALFNQCSTFNGPISAAVYLPLVQTESSKGERGGQQPGVDTKLSPGNQERVRLEVERLTKLYKT